MALEKRYNTLQLLFVCFSLSICTGSEDGLSQSSVDIVFHLGTIGTESDSASLRARLGPKRIPQILHQTYWTPNISDSVKHWPTSWRKLNLQWDAKFYKDQDCLDFVEQEFPEYLQAYTSLAKPVERADFFRYMILLRRGGMYADIDTECVRPLDLLFRTKDELVVGWEDEYSTTKQTDQRHWFRPRQLANFAIAAAPGHPALKAACDRIAANPTAILDNDTILDTSRRTGATMFTEVVLQYAATKGDGDMTVRFLPKTAFGNTPPLYNGLSTEQQPVRFLLHHSMGSWKNQFAKKKPTKDRGDHNAFAKQLFPVEMQVQQSFVMLLPLAGQGDMLSGIDVAAMLTSWGSWQYPSFLIQQPPVVEMLLPRPGGSSKAQQVLLDIGAGVGYFSLAAAARGWKAIAFELANKSTASFKASVRHNKFQDRITIHEAALGKGESICTDRLLPRTKVTAFGIDIERGYGHPKLQAVTSNCSNITRRHSISTFVPSTASIDAIRISASGWEAWVLQDLRDIIQHAKPSIVLIEVYPSLLENTLFPGGLDAMIQQLLASGYTRGQHMGYLCVEKRLQTMRAAHSKASAEFYHQSAMKQAGWCRLNVKKFKQLLQTADESFPELLAFRQGSARE